MKHGRRAPVVLPVDSALLHMRPLCNSVVSNSPPSVGTSVTDTEDQVSTAASFFVSETVNRPLSELTN